MEIFTHHVQDFRRIRDRLVSVCTSFGNVHLPVVVSRQLVGNPFGIRRRVGPQIENDIVYCPTRAADYLCLRVRTRLEMHAAQRPRFAVESRTALHHTSLEAPFCRFFFIPRPREKTTHVLEALDLYNVDARYFGLGEFHSCLYGIAYGSLSKQ